MADEKPNLKLSAELNIPGHPPIILPIKSGTLGSQVIDVASLKQQGFFTFDPGFLSTAACESKITFIDGNKGILLHRGYPIEQLAKQANYLEVCYLLLYGDLPTANQKTQFEQDIHSHTLVHEQIRQFFNGFPRSSHPMAILCGVVGGLSAFYHDALNVHDSEHREIAALRLIAKLPTLAAMAYKYSIGQPFVYPNNHLGYAENFLNMLFSVPADEQYQVNPILADAMDKILILHADHEQNASTSTVRLAGSSLANPFACIASGITALWGPAHGGANEAVLNMLTEIGTIDNIPKFIQRAKDKNDSFRLMGFGHRVYKNFDPRAKVLKESCHEVLQALNIQNDPLLEIALELEKIALKDEYFIEKKLYPNVDFYSGIILNALGIPTNMFTVIFALARTVGWIANWQEMMNEQNLKIGRPRQLYTGVAQRDFVPIEKRLK